MAAGNRTDGVVDNPSVTLTSDCKTTEIYDNEQ
jgi:hypothetical protein